MGTGEVVYSRKADAEAALAQYNGVQLDGKPMQISFDNDIMTLGSGIRCAALPPLGTYKLLFMVLRADECKLEVTDACACADACVHACCCALLFVPFFSATGTSQLFVHRSVTRPGGGNGGGRGMRTRVSGWHAAMYTGAAALMASQGSHATLRRQLPELPVCDNMFMSDLYCSCCMEPDSNGAYSECCPVEYAGCGRHDDGVIFAWTTTCVDAVIDTAAEERLRVMVFV